MKLLALLMFVASALAQEQPKVPDPTQLSDSQNDEQFEEASDENEDSNFRVGPLEHACMVFFFYLLFFCAHPIKLNSTNTYPFNCTVPLST